MRTHGRTALLLIIGIHSASLMAADNIDPYPSYQTTPKSDFDAMAPRIERGELKNQQTEPPRTISPAERAATEINNMPVRPDVLVVPQRQGETAVVPGVRYKGETK